MLSRSRARFVPLRDVAADVGLCISGLRVLKVRYPTTSRGMYCLRYIELLTDKDAVGIRKIHTVYRRPLVCANRLQVLQSRRAGIIHWWHPKTPKTDEILDDVEVIDEPVEEKQDEKKNENPPQSPNILLENPQDSSEITATLIQPSPTPPQNEESCIHWTPTSTLPSSKLREKPHISWKPKYGYSLKLNDFENAEDLRRRTRDGVDMDSEHYLKWGTRPVVVPKVIEDFRRTMRALPGPIVVLTAAKYCERAPNIYRGITISSFSSLSMSPEPLVTFNIKSELKPDVKPSRALHTLRKAPHFLIHIINDTPEGVRLANFFATVHEHQFTPEAQEKGGFEVEELTGFRQTVGLPLVLPRLKGKGISRVLRCEIMRGGICVPGYDILGPNIVDHEIEPRNKLYTASNNRSLRRGFIRIGDHVLCIGKVHEVMENDPPVPDNAMSGLGYMDGKYRSVGEVLAVPRPESNLENKP